MRTLLALALIILFSLRTAEAQITFAGLPPITADNAHQLALLKTISVPNPNFNGRDFGAVFSPEGEQIVLGQRGKLTLINLVDGATLAEIEIDHNFIPRDLYFSQDGTHLAVLDGDQLCVWDISANLVSLCASLFIRNAGDSYFARVNAVAFSADSFRLYVATTQSGVDEEIIHIFDLDQARAIDRLLISECWELIAFNRTATRLACVKDQEIRLYDVADLMAEPQLILTEGSIRRAALSADTTRLFVSQVAYTEDPELPFMTTYDIETGQLLSSIDLDVDLQVDFAGNQDGSLRFNTYSSSDGLVDGQSGNILFNSPMRRSTNIVFNSTGTLMALIPYDNKSVGLYGVVDCFATTARDINLRQEPNTEAQIGDVLSAGQRLALFANTTSSNFTWWQTGDGLWLREDVADVQCAR